MQTTRSTTSGRESATKRPAEHRARGRRVSHDRIRGGYPWVALLIAVLLSPAPLLAATGDSQVADAEESVLAEAATEARLVSPESLEEAARSVVEETAAESGISTGVEAQGVRKERGFVNRYLKPRHGYHWAYIACTAFDAATTAAVLASGGKELNPLIAPEPKILLPAMKIGHYLLGRWLEDRHPNADEKVVWLPSALVYCGLGAWNSTQIR